MGGIFLVNDEISRAEIARTISSPHLGQKDFLIRAIQVLPNDRQKWVVKNVYYFSMYGKWYGRRMSRGLCQNKEIVFISEKAFPKTYDLETIETKFFVFLVLHETAHAIRQHRCRIYDGISAEEYDEQEREATGDALRWFNEYVSANAIPTLNEADVEAYREKLNLLVDEWERTWDKHLESVSERIDESIRQSMAAD